MNDAHDNAQTDREMLKRFTDKRIDFTDAMRAQADATLDSCPACGDDLGIHDWITASYDGEITGCDRAELLNCGCPRWHLQDEGSHQEGCEHAR